MIMIIVWYGMNLVFDFIRSTYFELLCIDLD